MTDTRLTDQQLDEIEARAAALYEYATVADEEGQNALDQLTDVDVPQLVAELRQARARIAELEKARRLEWVRQGVTPHTPRICECGHSHHAHTVPDPHSCFAHGQTCDCPAYRQMSQDDAVAHQVRKQAEYVPAVSPAAAGGVNGQDA